MLLFFLMKYKWFIKEPRKITKEFLDVCFNSEIIASLLLNRGINSLSDARSYLYPEYYKESPPEEIPDLLKAKERILRGIKNNERIIIYGDYDVDGVTATSCLLVTLKQFTNNVDFYIPNRLDEGYGLNAEAVKTIVEKNKKACHGVPLLITCDCGITNHKEIELANSLGMDVIVTDHHSLPAVLPPVYAVLNPKLLPEDHKLYHLPGVGVAYKLCEAILEGRQAARSLSVSEASLAPKEQGDKEARNDLLELVTLGMIADVVPLVNENRYLVQIGLPRLASTQRVGLKELLRICGFNIEHRSRETEKQRGREANLNTDHIGFGIAPRINAIGRLADAALAVRLLTTDDLAEATQIAAELDIQNRQRKLLCDQTLKEAIEMIEDHRLETSDLRPEKRNHRSQVSGPCSDKCIVLAKEGWHHGVLGIVASRIVERFFLPTILLTIDKEQNTAKGSGRSIEQLNITEVLEKCSSYLERYGGHKAACGLSLSADKLEDFVFYFKQSVNETVGDLDIEPSLKIDFELPLNELNLELMSHINKLAPFGLGSPMPVFVSDEVEVQGSKMIGKDSKHLKLILQSAVSNQLSSHIFEGLIWNHNSNAQFNIGDKLKIAYTPKLNTYNGETFVQVEIKDWELLETRSREAEKQRSRENLIEVYDFRNRTQECLELLRKEEWVVYFAETEQKNFLPLQTFSRNKIIKTRNLVFLEAAPDEFIFMDIFNKAEPAKIYLAFNQFPLLSPQSLLKRLIGMLKYTASNKGSRFCEEDLQSALGINRSTLRYGLEILVKSGFLMYENIKCGQEFSINISLPSRQNFKELIEYNLFVSELEKISTFREWMYNAEIRELLNKLKQAGIKFEIVIKGREKSKIST